MRTLPLAAGLMAMLAMAGCQRTSMSDYGGAPSGPAPLQAQPVPSVSATQLPPPGAPGASSQFPAAPVNTAAANPNPVPDAAPPAASLDVTKESMVGNWRVTSSGSSCDMFLTLTNLGSGSRGGTRGCAGELTQMGSWEVAGKQVILKSRSGDPIARLYKSADARFDGSTTSGQSVSLSR
ncbi:hypothetical protein BJF93_20210 [Xaviernesmea oryzae]|uniref:Outer membrane lipoprotein omp19 n=1 Tax=Xaviernesmea oryzae TaxID=464029 RepID=A0A1Q9AVZ5_9HYPH|nr:protease inhibitor Inh/omp19 family protein [Xaviernesmea oryzae]OLP59605.1 hypothetical protein BJF93_20210 [Xaviernesmea oryzae]SEM13889.1 Protease inhibitor Inh [Xaviernesmea oryzae]